ncbi:MAG TPA: Spy/CpxP family protein refolding chaperone [Acetobacteraceae bacterium]|nr:Spy/CpxP family protein refolding chaperone [Acetobacteraceae bacterium]
MTMTFATRTIPALLISTALLGSMAVPAIAESYANNPNNRQAITQSSPSWSIEQMTHQRLSQLYDNLRITPNQQPAWNRFAQSSLQNASALEQLYRQRRDSMQSMDAVQNLNAFARIQTQQAQDLQRLVPEFQALYTVLSPQQRQTADQMFRNYSERGRSQLSQR